MEKQQEFIYCKRKWRGIHCEEYWMCVTVSNNILESAIREENMLCATASLIVKICCMLLPASICDEDVLCVTASLIMKKICCVLLPASL